MIPSLNGIDHVHVYVSDRRKAEEWYGEVMGFKPLQKFLVWAEGGGPLTLEDPSGKVHLAVFESDKEPDSTIAFGATGEEFLAWKAHLESHSLQLRLADHDLAWSMYFHDPFGNYHEITTYEHELVRQQLG